MFEVGTPNTSDQDGKVLTWLKIGFAVGAFAILGGCFLATAGWWAPVLGALVWLMI